MKDALKEIYVTEVIPNCLRFREDMRRRLSEDHGIYPIWDECTLEDVKKVCLILSSPRSGSSVFIKKLKELTDIYFLQGEETPFYEMHGLNNFPDGDFNPTITDEQYKLFSRDMLSDFWKHTSDRIDLHTYQTIIFGRLCFQLPNISVEDLFKVRDTWLIDCLPLGERVSKEQVYAKLFNAILRYNLQFNPYYWDGTQDFISHYWQYCVPASGPANPFLIEEAPFVMAERHKMLIQEDLKYKTLLIKNPTNCYRKEFIKKIYPNAEIKVIHLTRNPAATINGLMDGWLHHGFYSFNLTEELNIEGYTETNPSHSHFWNFDMPPNWRELTNSKLVDVCAEQWYQAHKAILDDWYDAGIKHHHVQLENFLDEERRPREIEGVKKFLKSSMLTSTGNSIPQVMATKHPRKARWREREDEILDCISHNPHIEDMAYDLHYGDRCTWI